MSSSDSDTDTEMSPPRKKRKVSTKTLLKCPYWENCYRRNPDHFAEFLHPPKLQERNIDQDADPIPSTSTASTKKLPKCAYGADCYRKNPAHFKEYSHDPKSDSSDTDTYYSGSEKEDDNSAKAIVSKASQLTKDEQKELLKTAFDAKEELEKEIEETKSAAKKKEEEVKELLIRMNKETMLMKGEKEALEKDKVVYFDLLPERSYKEGSASQFHMRLAESQFYRLLGTVNVRNISFQVQKVQYVVNPNLVKQFQEAKEDMRKHCGEDNSHSMLVFHETNVKNIPTICEEGFTMPKDGEHLSEYGCGVPFSEYTGSSIAYVKGASQLLLCQILPGKINKCNHKDEEDETVNQQLKDGYDSHSSPDRKEIVIFHPDRILPCYIVHYRPATTEFTYKTPAELQGKAKSEDELFVMFKKAQRTRKNHILGGRHIRLCGRMAADYETMGRLIRKFGGNYVDNEAPYCEPGEKVPVYVPGGLGFYPFKGKYRKLFNTLICSEKEFKSKKSSKFAFVEEMNFAYDVHDCSIVREEWLYDSITGNMMKDLLDYAWE